MTTSKLEGLSPSELKRIFRLKNYIIRIQLGVIILALCIGVILPLLITIHKRASKPAPLTPVTVEEGNPGIESYRKSLAYQRLSLTSAPKVKAIIHDFSDFSKYITFFEDFVKTHKIKTDYEWKVGFYPAIYELPEDSRPRLGVYVIPTMCNKDGKIDDYFELVKNDAENGEYSTYYLKDINDKPAKEFIYDQGTIFP